MKKIFLLAIMALAALTSVNAQNQEAGTFSLMPHLGSGYTNMSYDFAGTSFSDYANGLIGGEAKYQITNVFGISAGVDFEYRQSLNKKEITVPVLNIKAHTNIQPEFAYVNIPVLAQFNIGKHFGVKTGVQTSFLVHAEDGDGDNIKDEFKSTVVTIPVGVSYTFNIPIVMDLRYNIPVTKATEYDKTANSINLTVGYRFDFGK